MTVSMKEGSGGNHNNALPVKLLPSCFLTGFERPRLDTQGPTTGGNALSKARPPRLRSQRRWGPLNGDNHLLGRDGKLLVGPRPSRRLSANCGRLATCALMDPHGVRARLRVRATLLGQPRCFRRSTHAASKPSKRRATARRCQRHAVAKGTLCGCHFGLIRCV